MAQAEAKASTGREQAGYLGTAGNKAGEPPREEEHEEEEGRCREAQEFDFACRMQYDPVADCFLPLKRPGMCGLGHACTLRDVRECILKLESAVRWPLVSPAWHSRAHEWRHATLTASTRSQLGKRLIELVEAFLPAAREEWRAACAGNASGGRQAGLEGVVRSASKTEAGLADLAAHFACSGCLPPASLTGEWLA